MEQQQPEIHLTSEPARLLTDREVAKLFSGFVGALAQMTELDTLHAGINWVMNNPLFWQLLEQQNAMVKHVTQQLMDQEMGKGTKQ